jgi:hypothetical protein
MFYKPHPNTQKPPTRSEPWVYVDRQTRKRRRSEPYNGDHKAPEPEPFESSQQHSTYAAYLTSQAQAHLVRKVRITSTLLVNRNSQHFRISDMGDPIVDWTSERLKPLASYLALPWNCLEFLIWIKHITLALQSREEMLCRHINEPERVAVRWERNLAALREENGLFMEEYEKRRQSRIDDESQFDSDNESHQYAGSEVEMEDAPPLPTPTRNYTATVEDAVENSLSDFDDVEIEDLMELRRQYHAGVHDLQNAAFIPENISGSMDKSKPTIPVAANESAGTETYNEAILALVTDDGENNEVEYSMLPAREDLGEYDSQSSSSSDEGSLYSPSALTRDGSDIGFSNAIDSNNDGNNLISSPESDTDDVQPPPAPVLFPSFLIPAQAPISIVAERRACKKRTPIQTWSKTYAEFDRLQSLISSSPTPRKARYTALQSLVTSSSLFSPFPMLNGLPISFDSPSAHEPTRTSLVWK